MLHDFHLLLDDTWRTKTGGTVKWKKSGNKILFTKSCKHSQELTKHKPPVRDMFTDVYDKLPSRLQKQHQECMNHVAKYPHEYPTELYGN